MADHHHHHHHDHDHDHEHGDVALGLHPNQDAPPIAEEPLDPASQSLSEALRASFRVLKLIMVVVVALYLFSGVFTVDQREVGVLSVFGKQVRPPKQPGLHLSLPFPMSEVIKVSTSTKTVKVNAFWLEEGPIELSQRSARTPGLDPAIDGALLTGDQAIMHLLFTVGYKITGAPDYVMNVRDEERTMRAILREAAVAEAARSTADTIWSSPRQVTDGVRTRAQAALDALQAGITIEYVLADKSYFPLQAKDEFLRVQDAANKAREMINAAEAEREKKLVGAAGPAWQEIYTKITLLDNAEDGPQREQLMAQIAELLRTRASGVAGGRVKLALRDQARVLDDTLKEVERFNSWLAEYRQRPELTRLRLGQEVLNKLYASQDIVKWVLPAGQKQVGIWLNKDPKEAADAEKARVAATGAGSTGPKK